MDVASLDRILETLRANEPELRNLGVSHVAVFGSVARGDQQTGSDIDVLVDLDDSRPIGVFEYSRVKLFLKEILHDSADVVNRRTLRPLLRDNILRDAVPAF
ncbi:MAG: nucleotidyltransferase domain-containing protein [Bryobacteraceae bacterium]